MLRSDGSGARRGDVCAASERFETAASQRSAVQRCGAGRYAQKICKMRTRMSLPSNQAERGEKMLV